MTDRPAQGGRRQDLIDAALACVAEEGLAAATVRAVASRAGMTPGMIRHYFEDKEHLIRAAYQSTMSGMNGRIGDAAGPEDDPPRLRLRRFLIASISADVTDRRTFTLWSAFISQTPVNPAMAEIHREGYLEYRETLETLIAEVLRDAGRSHVQSERRRLGIMINAVADGLWLERCIAGDLFSQGELEALFLDAAESMLGLPLPPDPARRDP